MYHPVIYAENLLLWALERADRRKASMVLTESSPGQTTPLLPAGLGTTLPPMIAGLGATPPLLNTWRVVCC